MSIITTGSLSSDATSDTGRLLRSLDYLALAFCIFSLSYAWIYPSHNTSARAPGIEYANALFNVFCLYGTIRLVFVGEIKLFFEEKLFLLLIFIGIIGLFYSISPRNTLGIIRIELLTLFSYIFFRYRFSREFVVYTFVDVIGIIMILSVLAAFTNLGVMAGFDDGRWRGLFGHKNSLGEYSGLLLLMLFGLWRLKYALKVRHVIYAVATTLCLVNAGSATAIGVVAFAMSVFIATMFLAQSRLAQSLRLASFFSLLIILITAALLLIPMGAEFLGRDLTFTGRTEIWNWFLFFGNKQPWTGWGWATIGENEAMLGYIRETLKLPDIQTPHNGYISIIVELGYPALVVYIVWLLCVFVGASHKVIVGRDYFEAMRVALVAGLIVHNFFESTAGAIPSLWLLLLISTGRMKHPSIQVNKNDQTTSLQTDKEVKFGFGGHSRQ